MKRTRRTFKAIIVMLLAGGWISVSSWAGAQEGGTSGSVKDLSNDALGNYSVRVPSLGNYTLPASRLGYDNVAAPEVPTRGLNWETGVGKSHLIPALEIPAFIMALNGYSRLTNPNDVDHGKKVFSVTPSTFWDHVIHGPWVLDHDAFEVNQLMHPYQGAMYYGFARSAGLGYWESSIYTFAGSYLWETGGETTAPSINDQIASGIAGPFFGEALFRMASRLLEGGGEKPGFWRQLGAAVLSPPTGFNRLVFGERFKPVFPSRDPATFWRLRSGAFLNSHLYTLSGLNPIRRTDVTINLSMAYGLPGKPGYGYTRPFDYFNLEFIAVSNPKNPVEDVMIRGLLYGKEYEAGDSYRGAWGLFSGYDYISPQIFRVSSTAVSLGTTFQWWLAKAVALQSSVLGGVGYGAAGNIHRVGERDYHYGITPQGLLALRLDLGHRAMLDATGRWFYITSQGSSEVGGDETIGRLNMGLTVRIYGRHALGIQYLGSRRVAHYPDRPYSHQTAESFTLVYTLLGDTKFGAVEWR